MNKKGECAMKNYFYFPAIILLLTILFPACSNDEREIMPVSPSLEKFTDETERLPFGYLQSFIELKDAKIDFIRERNGIYIVISSISSRVTHLFVVIEEIEGKFSEMVFLDYNNETKHFVPGMHDDLKLEVKVYGFLTESAYTPYNGSQTFNNIEVIDWYVSESSIFVNTTEFSPGLNHIFAELETRQGSYLIFLGKPEKPFIEIEKYGDLEILNVKIFGYFLSFTDN